MPSSSSPTQLIDLIVYEGSEEVSRIPWEGRRLLIGRRTSADIQIRDPTLSASHAEILEVDGQLCLRDLKSLNGTEVNGARIGEAPIKPGDWVKLGEATMRVVERTTTSELELEAAPQRDGPPSSETMRVSLDLLQEQRHQTLGEDRSIRLLSDLFEGLRSADDRRQILAEVRTSLGEAFDRARVFVLERDGSGHWIDPEVSQSDDRPSQTVAEEAVVSNNAILSTYLPQDSRFAGAESIRITGIKTVIAAPASCDGRPEVVLYVDRLGLPAFSKSDLQLLGVAANHLTAVLENASRIAELRRTNQELSEARERLALFAAELEDRVRERTAEIQRQAEEIAELAEAKDELLGIAAHDIRGPLTIIQGNSELMRLRLDKLERGALDRSLGVIHDAAKGLSQLLSELLDTRAMESGKIKLNRRRYNVRLLLEEACAVGRLAADDNRIGMVLEVDPALEIEVDPRRLGQAISNLVLNAIKFSKPGTSIVIRTLTLADGGCEIAVADQGVGIREEELAKVFDAFERGRAGKRKLGSGLGLMIAKSLVEQHGGLLTVESQLGAGSCFRITLPKNS